MKNGHLRILNDIDSAGRGRKMDEEGKGTRRKKGQGGRKRRKERRGGRSDEESEKMKNEQGRVHGISRS